MEVFSAYRRDISALLRRDIIALLEHPQCEETCTASVTRGMAQHERAAEQQRMSLRVLQIPEESYRRNEQPDSRKSLQQPVIARRPQGAEAISDAMRDCFAALRAARNDILCV